MPPYDDSTVISSALPDIPDLSGYDTGEEVRTPWENGWYQAVVIPGYTTQNGHAFVTADEPSKDGKSRNINVCFEVTRKSDNATFNLFSRFANYRPEDFTTARLAFVETAKQRNTERIKAARTAQEQVTKQWDDTDAQRSHLAFVDLKALQDVAGTRLERNGTGGLNLTPVTGRQTFVYLGRDKENKYLEVKRTAQTLPPKAILL